MMQYLLHVHKLAAAVRLANMLNAAGAYKQLAAAQWLREQGAEWPPVLRCNLGWGTKHYFNCILQYLSGSTQHSQHVKQNGVSSIACTEYTFGAELALIAMSISHKARLPVYTVAHCDSLTIVYGFPLRYTNNNESGREQCCRGLDRVAAHHLHVKQPEYCATVLTVVERGLH
eukprot:5143-Heterococcus_DN1.PRE.1